MYHIFITRIAVQITGSAKTTVTQYKTYNNIDERLHDIIDYWFKHGSKFYELQTVDHPFVVYLVYSKMYEHVIQQYTYPPWVVTTTDQAIDQLKPKHIYTPLIGKDVSVSRIDADDWYCNNYFDYISQDHAYTDSSIKLTTHLHKRIRFYDRVNNRVSTPQYFASPAFATRVYRDFTDKLIPSRHLKLWPHGDIKNRSHNTPDQSMCIQSVGCNIMNRWKVGTSAEPDGELYNNFYIPK